MIFGSYSPLWFLGFDSLLEGLFFLITLLIGAYAYRIYRYGGGQQYRLWSAGFFLISFAYVINALTNLALYLELLETSAAPYAQQLLEIAQVYRAGLFVHTAVFLSGYLCLLLVSMRLTDKKVRVLLFALVLLLAFGSVTGTPLLEIATSLFIIFIVLSLSERTEHTLPNRLVMAGFAIVLVGQLAYMFIPIWGISYVAGHLLEFGGYGLLFASFIMILRK